MTVKRRVIFVKSWLGRVCTVRPALNVGYHNLLMKPAELVF